MMTKIRSVQDSWLAKGILVLTALSFMSLFGISSYIGNSDQNRPIIRVDDIVIYQNEITDKYNQQIQTAKNLFGDNLEVNDNMRSAILQGIVQKELVKAIMQKTAEDMDVSVSDDLVRKIIFSQAEFMDDQGRFDMQKLRRTLSASGWSEQRYINALRQDIEKQHLVQNPVENMNAPKFMVKYVAEIDNQKKVFNYININPKDIKTDRKITAEEIEQYYQDFAAQFVEPESRDVSFIVLSSKEIENSITPSEEEIREYYKENISQFVIPENRKVLQMVFDNKDKADAAYAKLKSGDDFYKTAKEEANQEKADTELGGVSKDMLIADMADAVFDLKNGEYTSPIKSEMGWHIMKVTGITPVKETKLEVAKAQITDIIRKEKAYDAAYEISTQIEDKIGAGASLEDIARQHNVKINQVERLNEDGNFKNAAPEFKKLITGNDFVDTAFSYNNGEISQVMEGDEGFVIARIDHIYDAHAKPLESVKAEIERMWTVSEQNAIAQELVNDVTHDVENGDDIAEVASRFKLKLNVTKPIERTESFAGLSKAQIADLFQENIGQPQVIADGSEQLIIVPVEAINEQVKLTPGEQEVMRAKFQAAFAQNVADSLIDSYSAKYDVRVKYRQLGLED